MNEARQRLTYRQLNELDKLANDPTGTGYYGSCTNPTMNALKRRGLVAIQWSEALGSIYRSERWVITDAGKALSRIKP